MKKPHLYLGLCTDFFDLDKPTASFAEYSFYLSYIQQASGSILEPMCGTGRYLIPYVQQGYTIDGFDASPFMLERLYKKCALNNIKPQVWEQFLEDKCIKSTQYNLIFIPDSSFCLFLNYDMIMQCLHNIYDMLAPNGTFVFDVETIYSTPAYPGIWQGKAHYKENGQLLIMNTLPLSPTNNTATVVCKYELIEKTEIIHTEVEYFQIKLYEPWEMDDLLKKVGFQSIKRIKTYTFHQEPSSHDHTIAYECIK
jgi:SAM-dependent methyltransferase